MEWFYALGYSSSSHPGGTLNSFVQYGDEDLLPTHL
jgi:hypothetical protein